MDHGRKLEMSDSEQADDESPKSRGHRNFRQSKFASRRLKSRRKYQSNEEEYSEGSEFAQSQPERRLPPERRHILEHKNNEPRVHFDPRIVKKPKNAVYEDSRYQRSEAHCNQSVVWNQDTEPKIKRFVPDQRLERSEYPQHQPSFSAPGIENRDRPPNYEYPGLRFRGGYEPYHHPPGYLSNDPARYYPPGYPGFFQGHPTWCNCTPSYFYPSPRVAFPPAYPRVYNQPQPYRNESYVLIAENQNTIITPRNELQSFGKIKQMQNFKAQPKASAPVLSAMDRRKRMSAGYVVKWVLTFSILLFLLTAFVRHLPPRDATDLQ